MNVYMAIKGSDHREIMICFNPIDNQEKSDTFHSSPMSMAGEICVLNSDSGLIKQHDFRMLNSVKRRDHSLEESDILMSKPFKDIKIRGSDMDSILGLRNNKGAPITLMNCREEGSSVACSLGIIVTMIDDTVQVMGGRSFCYPSDLAKSGWEFYSGGFSVTLPEDYSPSSLSKRGVPPSQIMSMVAMTTNNYSEDDDINLDLDLDYFPPSSSESPQKKKNKKAKKEGSRRKSGQRKKLFAPPPSKNDKKRKKISESTKGTNATPVVAMATDDYIEVDSRILIRIFTNYHDKIVLVPVYLGDKRVDLGQFSISLDHRDDKTCETHPFVFSWINSRYENMDTSEFMEIVGYLEDGVMDITPSQHGILSRYLKVHGII